MARAGFDTVGTLLLALTLGAYALAMTMGRGSISVLNMALLAAAAVGAGLFVFAEGRVASERRNALVVPASAVDVTGVKPFVIRLKQGKVERVDVELGLRDEESERIEVKTGIERGDTLLVGAARGISPGTPVRVSVPSDAPAAK